MHALKFIRLSNFSESQDITRELLAHKYLTLREGLVRSDKGFRKIVGAVIACFLLSSIAHASELDPRFEFRSLGNGAAQLFMESHFDELDRLVNEWSSSNERLGNGLRKLEAFHFGLAEALFARKRDWPAFHTQISNWRKQRPTSVAAALSDAYYWEVYAWEARGNGMASTVARDAWKLFGERIHNAEAALVASKSFADSSPEWYAEYIRVAIGLNWPKSKLLTLFDEATARYPSYRPLYFSVAEQLGPRWGGSEELLDAFIQRSVAMTRAEDGSWYYTLLYQYATRDMGSDFDLFRDTKATWKLLRQGFADQVARYPRDFATLNEFASYTCKMNEGATYLSLRKQIGKKVYQDMWLEQFPYEMCDRRYSFQG